MPVPRVEFCSAVIHVDTSYGGALPFRVAMNRLASRSPSPVFLRVLFFIVMLAVPAFGQFQVPARPAAYVNDYANVLKPDAKAQLETLCTEINNKAKAQVFVVTIDTTGDVPIEDYSIALATKWKIGPKSNSGGTLILFAINDRKNRIEVGYGLESILNDGKVGAFTREAQPLLRAGDLSGGIVLVTRRVIDVIAQDRGITLDGGSLPVAQPLATNTDTAAASRR